MVVLPDIIIHSGSTHTRTHAHTHINGTWSVKLGYNANATDSCFLNNLRDGFMRVHVGHWVVSTLTHTHTHTHTVASPCHFSLHVCQITRCENNWYTYWLSDRVKVLRPPWHKLGHFRDVQLSQSICGLLLEKSPTRSWYGHSQPWKHGKTAQLLWC